MDQRRAHIEMNKEIVIKTINMFLEEIKDHGTQVLAIPHFDILADPETYGCDKYGFLKTRLTGKRTYTISIEVFNQKYSTPYEFEEE